MARPPRRRAYPAAATPRVLPRSVVGSIAALPLALAGQLSTTAPAHRDDDGKRRSHTRRRRRTALVLALALAGLLATWAPSAFGAGFEPTGSLDSARHYHTATPLDDGRVLVAGGCASDGCASTSAEIYDPATGSWSAADSLDTGRYHHTATPLPDGGVLVVGGVDEQGGSDSSAEIYDPATDSWSAAGAMDGGACCTYSPGDGVQYGWSRHTATSLADGRVLIASGYTAGGLAAEIYDPATDSWSPVGSLATGREFHTATLLADGRVLVAGGDTHAGATASAEIYDPATDSWSAADSLATARHYHTAAPLPDGRVLVAGGVNSSGIEASAEIYDPATDSWSAADSLDAGRFWHTATALADGRVLVAGGQTHEGSGSAEIYDPATNSWSAAGSLATARYLHTATPLADGRVLLAAGASGSGGASAEIYDPNILPTAVDDSASVGEDAGPTTIDVLANDTDPDGGTIEVDQKTDGSHGTVAITNSGADLTYTPEPDYCNDPPGTALDTFTYSLNGGSIATVSVKVTCVNDPPAITSPSSFSAAENQTAAGTVTSADPDGDPPAYAISGGADAAHFSIGASSGVLAFSSAPDFEAPADADADNVYDVTVEASDGNGGTTSQSIAVTVTNVDDTEPTTTIDDGPADNSITNDPTPTFEFSSNEAGSFQCSLVAKDQAENWGACSGPGDTHTPDPALADGDYIFAVRATDAANNTDSTPDSRDFAVDATAPAFLEIDFPFTPTNESTPAYGGRASSGAGDDGFVTLAVHEGGSEAGTLIRAYTPVWINPSNENGFFKTEETALADGTYTLVATQEDEAGNEKSASLTFTVDTAAPNTTIDEGPANNSTTNDPTPTFEFSSNEAGSFECSLVAAGQAADFSTPCSGPGDTHTPDPALADGDYTFSARATDAANNTDATEDSRDFTVDTTPPSLTIDSGPTGQTTNRRPTFGFTAGAGAASVVCSIDHGTEDFGACTGESSHEPAPDLADGNHTFRVLATDAAGNSTSKTRTFSVTTPPASEPVPPPADGGGAGDGGDAIGDGGGGEQAPVGTDGNDTLVGTDLGDLINGLTGDDVINGGLGDDRLIGEAGADEIFGGDGDDLIRGGKGKDKLDGGAGNDRVFGGAGNDKITADDGETDLINCGKGRDVVVADDEDEIAKNCEKVR